MSQTATKSQPVSSGTANETSGADDIGLERLVFFSDAVFAIAITLLSLDIRLPDLGSQISDAEMVSHLIALGPRYFAYFISFAVIGLIWMGHHRLFRYVGGYDSVLMLLVLLELMFIAFLPFPSSLIGAYHTAVVTVFYAMVLTCIGLIAAVMWWYVTRDNRLLRSGLDVRLVRRTPFELLWMPAVFLLSAPVAVFWSVDLAWDLWWGILILSGIIVVRSRRRFPGSR